MPGLPRAGCLHRRHRRRGRCLDIRAGKSSKILWRPERQERQGRRNGRGARSGLERSRAPGPGRPHGPCLSRQAGPRPDPEAVQRSGGPAARQPAAPETEPESGPGASLRVAAAGPLGQRPGHRHGYGATRAVPEAHPPGVNGRYPTCPALTASFGVNCPAIPPLDRICVTHPWNRVIWGLLRTPCGRSHIDAPSTSADFPPRRQVSYFCGLFVKFTAAPISRSENDPTRSVEEFTEPVREVHGSRIPKLVPHNPLCLCGLAPDPYDRRESHHRGAESCRPARGMHQSDTAGVGDPQVSAVPLIPAARLGVKSCPLRCGVRT